MYVQSTGKWTLQEKYAALHEFPPGDSFLDARYLQARNLGDSGMLFPPFPGTILSFSHDQVPTLELDSPADGTG